MHTKGIHKSFAKLMLVGLSASIVKQRNKSLGPRELGSDGGARSPNWAKANIFLLRNWSLDFFRHALSLLFECLSSLRSVGPFLVKQKTDVPISWDALLHRETPLENQHIKKDAMGKCFRIHVS